MKYFDLLYKFHQGLLSKNALTNLDEICREGQNISIITKLELLGYNFSSIENETLTKEFVNKSIIHQITSKIEDDIIKFRKETRIKLPDAIIAATAIKNGFTLITSNSKRL